MKKSVIGFGLLIGLVFAFGAILPAVVMAGLFQVPVGEFEVVALRRASDVAGGPIDKTVKVKIGDKASFGEKNILFGGRSCDGPSWQMLEKLGHEKIDPNLSDVFLPPLTGNQSVGDKRVSQVMRLRCTGEDIAFLIYVDRRVLVARSPSGQTYYVLAKPLSAGRIRKFQAELKSMKFYEGPVKQTWDEASQRAVAAYAEYRGAKFRFLHPVISENLLDGLKILPAMTR